MNARFVRFPWAGKYPPLNRLSLRDPLSRPRDKFNIPVAWKARAGRVGSRQLHDIDTAGVAERARPLTMGDGIPKDRQRLVGAEALDAFRILAA